jgi:hypothetical protein
MASIHPDKLHDLPLSSQQVQGAAKLCERLTSAYERALEMVRQRNGGEEVVVPPKAPRVQAAGFGNSRFIKIWASKPPSGHRLFLRFPAPTLGQYVTMELEEDNGDWTAMLIAEKHPWLFCPTVTGHETRRAELYHVHGKETTQSAPAVIFLRPPERAAPPRPTAKSAFHARPSVPPPPPRAKATPKVAPRPTTHSATTTSPKPRPSTRAPAATNPPWKKEPEKRQKRRSNRQQQQQQQQQQRCPKSKKAQRKRGNRHRHKTSESQRKRRGPVAESKPRKHRRA